MLRALSAMVLVVKCTHKSKTPPFPQKGCLLTRPLQASIYTQAIAWCFLLQLH